MSRYKKFTKEDDEFLRLNYPTAAKAEILSRFPNKNWRNIIERASRLNLSRDLSFIHSNYRERDDDWQDYEIELIRNLYTNSTKEILKEKLIHRTWNAIKSRAHLLNLVLDEKENLEDKIFNYWKVLEHNGSKVKCVCIGCNQVIRILERYDVVNKRTKSCGCKFKELVVETCLSRYGVEHYLQTEEAQKRIKETNLKKHGVASNFDRKGQREKNTQRTLQTKLKKGNIKKITENKTLADMTAEVGANYSHALHLYSISKELALNYLKNYNGPKEYGTTEILFKELVKDNFPNLKKYNLIPREFKIKNKPDFRIEANQKVLYVNLDGLFWHSSRIKKNNNYHLDLQRNFAKNNQTIFQFRENELRDKPRIVRSIVLNYLGLSKNKYFARKLTIREVSYKNSSAFFEENHLMGSIKAKSFGLYKDQELVSCMSIKQVGKNLEIARFASKLDSNVVGGFSKLLNHIIKIKNPQQVVSWCDMRYSTGKSYEELGFIKEKTVLGWNWTDFQHTYNRLKCHANMDQRHLSQAEYANELGWHQIYDAGQTKYIKQVRENQE